MAEYIIYGKASVEIVDSENELIRMSALEKSLPQLLKRARLTINHTDIIVGEILESFEHNGTIYKTEVVDDTLWVVGKIYNDSQYLNEIINGIDTCKYNSFSISGYVLSQKTTCDKQICYNDITDFELSSITICEKGMNPQAKFRRIKGMRERSIKNSIKFKNRLKGNSRSRIFGTRTYKSGKLSRDDKLSSRFQKYRTQKYKSGKLSRGDKLLSRSMRIAKMLKSIKDKKSQKTEFNRSIKLELKIKSLEKEIDGILSILDKLNINISKTPRPIAQKQNQNKGSISEAIKANRAGGWGNTEKYIGGLK